MTELMVLMAATPSQPAESAVRAGSAMSVMLGVILAHTGFVALALIQPHTSCMQWPTCDNKSMRNTSFLYLLVYLAAEMAEVCDIGGHPGHHGICHLRHFG